ncbi:STAS domain-containing protein [Streptomyces sp. AS02]|uniref:STAS domain-containing protein n=1 Tax=Streptomyces sp. AS02 TaxID=2938946 RepID=UPI0020227389|nr:STAS domain-containing protein [Streptomyces sp. AS02]MCL8011379.1 STAS domain-containing protein [Streptomyces sp. AS02]
MTPPLPPARLLTAAAWLLACALATAAAIHFTAVWTKMLCLIAAATALRIAAKAVWSAARPARASQEPLVVHLRGEITAATADNATQRLADALAARPRALEIDMSRVELLTNDGATAFFAAARIAHKQGTEIIVRNANTQGRATLHVLGLDRLQQYRDE